MRKGVPSARGTAPDVTFDEQDKLQALDLAQVCIRSVDGVIHFWSRGNERLYGWSAKEAVGARTHQLLATTFPAPLADIEAELRKAGHWEGELQHYTKRGDFIWVASNWILQRDRKDSPPYVVEVNNDVTGARRADEARRHLGTIVESSFDAIISKDLNGTVQTWNSGAERIFGYTQGEMTGQSVARLFPPHLAQEGEALIQSLKRGERIEHYETLRVTKSGKQINVSITSSPVYDAAGMLIGASEIARDISEKKEWENALVSNENRRRLAAEAGELGLWTFDVATAVSDWDPLCKSIFGWRAEAPAPGYEEVMNFIHPEDRERVDAEFQATLREGTPFDSDFRVLHSDGRIRWVHSKGRASFNQAGAVGGAHGTLLDFTARKQREEALLRANLELEQFAYAAAHDLQEPLRNAALSIDLARRDAETHLSSQSAFHLEHALHNSQRMHSMVKDLLAYAKAVGEEDVDEAVIADANAALADALESLSVAIHSAGADVQSEKLPPVRMQPIHLQEIFQNLLSNALKYCSTAPVRVTVSAVPRLGFQEFAVSDNGIGIDPQFQGRVFGVFKRLRDKEAPGTGMGLALCKRIVEHYGGKIWVESAKGQGATFRFTVPAAQAHGWSEAV